jgi:hypothetical protein
MAGLSGRLGVSAGPDGGGAGSFIMDVFLDMEAPGHNLQVVATE